MKRMKLLSLIGFMALVSLFSIQELVYANMNNANTPDATETNDKVKVDSEFPETPNPLIGGGRDIGSVMKDLLKKDTSGNADHLATFKAELQEYAKLQPGHPLGDLKSNLHSIDVASEGLDVAQKQRVEHNIITALTETGLVQIGGKSLKDYAGVTDNANNAELLANLQALDLIAPVVNNMEGVRNIDSTNKEVAFYSSEYVLNSTEEFKVNVAADIEADRTPVIVLGNATDEEIDNALDQVKLAQGLQDQIKILEQTGLGNKDAVIELSKTINGSVMNSQTALKDKTSVDTMKRSARARTLQ